MFQNSCSSVSPEASDASGLDALRVGLIGTGVVGSGTCQVLARNAGSMPKIVHRLPDSADILIATLKLKAMGIRLDVLTGAQDTYLHSWQEGT